MKKFVLLALVFSLPLFVLVVPASATSYYGNNSFSAYRLPWQHGDGHYLSQGYNEGNHTGFQPYSLDFTMNTGTPILAITEGWTCQYFGSGLGTYVVQQAPGYGRSGTDYYFYGHASSSWVSPCSSGWTYLYEGQIAAWSGCSGTCTGPHVHVAVENPGHTCYCSNYYPVTSVPVSSDFRSSSPFERDQLLRPFRQLHGCFLF